MLRPISRKELIKKLKKLGFEGPYSGGNHQSMQKESFKISIPNPHGGKDIGKKLISLIIKELDISIKDFFNL